MRRPALPKKFFRVVVTDRNGVATRYGKREGGSYSSRQEAERQAKELRRLGMVVDIYFTNTEWHLMEEPKTWTHVPTVRSKD